MRRLLCIIGYILNASCAARTHNVHTAIKMQLNLTYPQFRYLL
jgi:hypothetical protein